MKSISVDLTNCYEGIFLIKSKYHPDIINIYNKLGGRFIWNKSAYQFNENVRLDLIQALEAKNVLINYIDFNEMHTVELTPTVNNSVF